MKIEQNSVIIRLAFSSRYSSPNMENGLHEANWEAVSDLDETMVAIGIRELDGIQ